MAVLYPSSSDPISPESKQDSLTLNIMPPLPPSPPLFLCQVTLDRPTGIEFATDLSLKYVYVMEIKENSAADLATVKIDVGNQLVGINGEECIGQPFADVANLLAKDPSVPLTFRFFRGSKQELLTAVGREDYVATSSVRASS